MVRFSLVAVVAVAASVHQSNAFQTAGPASRVTSRRPAVAVESSDASIKIPTPQAPKPDGERDGAMMDLSGVVLSVSCMLNLMRRCLCALVQFSLAFHPPLVFQGLKGQALSWTNEDFPSAPEIRQVIPKDCFEPETAKSLGYLSVSVIGTALCTAIGTSMLSVLPPENPLTFPFWAAYSAVTGTVAMGLWVLAHECGHGAFSKNKALQDGVGYAIHSLMLVPYFSWQRSHAVHHQYTNHMELGETHVPEPMIKEGDGSLAGREFFVKTFGKENGVKTWGALQGFLHLVIGWPAYLMIGATGGSARGMTNHFYPEPLTTPDQPKKELFPGQFKEKVYQSDIGIAAVVAGVLAWAACNGIPQVMALYGGPLLIINAWLVLYTWCAARPRLILAAFVSYSLTMFSSTVAITTGYNIQIPTCRITRTTITILSRALCIPLTALTTSSILGASLTFCITRLGLLTWLITLIRPCHTIRHKLPRTQSRRTFLICIFMTPLQSQKLSGECARDALLYKNVTALGFGTMKASKMLLKSLELAS